MARPMRPKPPVVTFRMPSGSFSCASRPSETSSAFGAKRAIRSSPPASASRNASSPVPFGSERYTERGGQPLIVFRDVILTGENLTDAQPGFDSQTQEPTVNLVLDAKGARVFRDVTRENVGKRMAILLFEKGKGEVWIDGHRSKIKSDDAIVVPAGARHNIVNTGEKPLRLYTLYAPPEHRDGAVHKTKADADTADEHFDGETSE